MLPMGIFASWDNCQRRSENQHDKISFFVVQLVYQIIYILVNFDGIFVIFDGKQHFGRKIAMGFFNRKKSENQELRHLGRRELAELLREQTRRATALEKEADELKKQLSEYETALQNAKSLAEEALCISEVFEKAISDSRQHVAKMQQTDMKQFRENELERHEDRDDSAPIAD